MSILTPYLIRLFTISLLALTVSNFSNATQLQVSPPNIVEINELEQAVLVATSLNSTEREEAKSLLDRIKGVLNRTEQETVSTSLLVADALRAKTTLQATLAKEDAIASEPWAIDPDRQSAAELSNKLSVLQAERVSLSAQLDEFQAELTTLSSRPSFIAQALASARAELAALNEVSRSLSALGPLARVGALSKQAELYALQRHIQNLEDELATVPTRQPVIAARVSLAQKQLAQIDSKTVELQGMLSSTRLGRANAIVESSRAVAASLENPTPELTEFAKENVALAIVLRDIVVQAPLVEQSTVDLRAQITTLQQSHETVERVLATGRISDELADVLRKLRAGLPSITTLDQIKSDNADKQISRQLDLILWQDKFRKLADVDFTVARLARENVASDLSVEPKLVSMRVDILTQMIDAAIEQINSFANKDLAVTEALASTQSLMTQLDGRLLWLPSGLSLTGNVLNNIGASFRWLTDPIKWAKVGHDFIDGALVSPILSVIFLALPFLILILRSSLQVSMAALANRVGNVGRDTYWTTPLALIETVLLALPAPLLIGVISGVVLANPAAEAFSKSIATGLAAASSIFLILLVFRTMCRPTGLFTGHFQWSEAATERLRHALLWFLWVEVISAFLFASALASGLTELRYGLAILAFIAASVAIAVFNFVFFAPKKGIAASIAADTRGGPIMTLAFLLLVLLPLGIGVLPLFGFYDTATELQSRLFQSGVVLILSAISVSVLMRLNYVALRRFAFRQTVVRRAEIEAIRSSAIGAQASGEAVPTSRSSDEVDSVKINDQTRSILSGLAGLGFLIGLWAIWSPLLPALGIANDIVLWQRSHIANGIEVSSDVTLWNLTLSVMFLGGGILAARNIRGILEIGIFERMSLDAGERYAAVTILGYVIVALGLGLSFAQLGIDWSKLQWIVAALGVGLGFGLQEIVANFISGLIILFERPVRVGDTVTIGALSGTVSNIKIRATTITDFDNRDVLIPNKSLITENVTNWTLTDSVTRLTLYVGVAYGSSISHVRSLLIDVIEAHQDVLKVPPPTVFFMQHGDSSLNFELRIFVDGPAKRLPVTHDINEAINMALMSHGIEIPFPQRTVHIADRPLAK
jgi:potassium efflux system protein